ncbi:hypothetical protein GCM10027299_47260 [Larkinella ripae]
MNPLFSAIGIGSLGLQTLEHLLNRGLHDLTFIAYSTDSESLRASAIPHKVLIDPDQPTAEHGLEGLYPLEESTGLVFIVADLNDPETVPILLPIAHWLQSKNRPGVALLPLPADPQPDLIQRLGGIFASLMVFRPADSTGEAPLHQLVLAIEGLANLGRQTLGTTDFADIQYLLRGAGRIAVLHQEAEGETRSETLLAKAINQLENYSFDTPRVDRVLMQLSASPASPVLMREQWTLTSGLLTLFSNQPRLFKTGYVSDAALGNRIQITLLLWTPLEEPV